MKKIKVSVRLVGGLKRFNPKENYESNLDLFIDQESTVENILKYLNIPKNFTTITYVDGKIFDRKCRIPANSSLTIFPPIMGG